MANLRLQLLATIALMVGGPVLAAPGDDDPASVEFFEKKIRPVLVNKCYKCHSTSGKKSQGGLLLDTREGIRRGGESGHAVVPGDLSDSLLIEAIRYDGLEMPPDEQLPDAVIADFEHWVRSGAADPRTGKSAPIRREIDFDRAREFWAYQPVRNPDLPAVSRVDWCRSEIDRFVLAKLDAAQIHPVADAPPDVLVRRLYFDLIGLPPSPVEVDAFVAAHRDDPQAAIESVLDTLLASSHFGERWGRHWLDVVRYAESTGMERNFTFPHAWRYRDYVIDAFNTDKPFDRFLTEQIAGDLLPFDDLAERDAHFTATGMLALGPKSLNGTNREQFLMDVVDDQIDVTSRAFMGLTVSCARCHDHKFDPIPTSEYYALAGIFRSTDTFYGTNRQNGNRQAGRLLALADSGVSAVGVGNAGGGNARRLRKQLQTTKKRLAALEKQFEKAVNNPKARAAARNKIQTARKQQKRLQEQVRRQAPKNEDAKATGDATFVMGVRDSAQVQDTPLRVRGEANDRGPVVPRGFLTIATLGGAPEVPDEQSGRLEYARWLTSPANPLTARVAVNRIWQHLFGRGIVASVNNFGANGDRPTHPELLDYLAARFVANGWSTKELIRDIVLSRTYQLSSKSHPSAAAGDPENKLLWRSHQRRLEVESIRDAILAVSGDLDRSPAEKSPVATVGDGNVGRQIRPSQFASDSLKRSVYLPIVRGAVPEILRLFDFPEPSIVAGQRDVTTVPTQALFMMNSEFVLKQSASFAQRVLESESDEAGRIRVAWKLAFARDPSDDEVLRTSEFLRAAREQFEGDNDSDAQARAWTGVCQTLFAAAEFRYVR